MTVDLSAIREELLTQLIAYSYGENQTVPGDFRRHALAQIDRLLPVVSKALAEAWGEGRASIGEDFLKPLDANGQRDATPNPYIVVSDGTANGGTE